MRILLMIIMMFVVGCSKEQECYTITKVTDHINIDEYDTYFTEEGRIFDGPPGKWSVGDVVCDDEI